MPFNLFFSGFVIILLIIIDIDKLLIVEILYYLNSNYLYGLFTLENFECFVDYVKKFYLKYSEFTLIEQNTLNFVFAVAESIESVVEFVIVWYPYVGSSLFNVILYPLDWWCVEDTPVDKLTNRAAFIVFATYHKLYFFYTGAGEKDREISNFEKLEFCIVSVVAWFVFIA